jgi:hypothetical protein
MLTLSTQVLVPAGIDHLEIINDFAKTQFHAENIVELSSNEFNVDGCLNDLRAYWNEHERSIRFIVRYKKMRV